MYFEIVGEVERVETIAEGASIERLGLLRRLYGDGRWRKLKGLAWLRLPGGNLRRAEVHWYEAHGIGRRRMKIKRFVE